MWKTDNDVQGCASYRKFRPLGSYAAVTHVTYDDTPSMRNTITMDFFRTISEDIVALRAADNIAKLLPQIEAMLEEAIASAYEVK